jgi:hypothetical protein
MRVTPVRVVQANNQTHDKQGRGKKECEIMSPFHSFLMNIDNWHFDTTAVTATDSCKCTQRQRHMEQAEHCTVYRKKTISSCSVTAQC